MHFLNDFGFLRMGFASFARRLEPLVTLWLQLQESFQGSKCRTLASNGDYFGESAKYVFAVASHVYVTIIFFPTFNSCIILFSISLPVPQKYLYYFIKFLVSYTSEHQLVSSKLPYGQLITILGPHYCSYYILLLFFSEIYYHCYLGQFLLLLFVRILFK